MSHFNRLYALVQEIEANTARLDSADAHARQQVVHRQIPGRLGRVTVSGSGLVSVDLDPRAVRYTNEAALGAAVLRAVTEADAEYTAGYQQAMAEAQRNTTA